MLRKICAAALLLSILTLSCNTRGVPVSRTDLIRRLPYAEVVPDTQVILFGTQEAKAYLHTGWSSPEKQGGEPFQWAVDLSSILVFRTLRPGPLYLHIRASSFFPNSARVLVNRQEVGVLKFQKEADDTSIFVPASALAADSNILEFNFAEARLPENKNDTRKLAAAFYSLVVTPGKYATEHVAAAVKEGLWKNEWISWRSKQVRALVAKTGLSLSYYEKLNPGDSLRFGTLFAPSPLAADDDFASFSVILHRDGAPEKQIFTRRDTSAASGTADVPVDAFLQGQRNAVCRIELRIERNSIFDSGITAWIEPELIRKEAPPQTDPQIESRLDALRRANRNANVVYILLDAGGAKHFSSYGYFRNTTPVIDSLGRESILFKHAYTQAVYTLASTATLMSGLDPLHHRIITRKSRLPEGTPTLADRFDDAGYSTGTFVANGNASGIFGMTRGFTKISEVFRDTNYTGWAMDITNHFTKWLDEKPRAPFFAYLHYREPHGPFNPPPEWKFKYTDPNYHGIAAQEDVRRAINFGEINYTQADKDYITALYDANLNYADSEVGRVLKKLKDLGIYDNTIVIVTADHGEAFWEHNFQGHNSQLYEESIHIPLIVKLTRASNLTGKTVDGFVRVVDHYPTLIDLLGFTRRGLDGDGRSVLPYYAGAPDDGRPVLTQTIMEQQYCYREGDYKFLLRLSNRAEEMYNLKQDPGETRNIVAAEPVQAAYLRTRLMGWLAEGKRKGLFLKGEHAVIDDSARENLKALGYVDN